jgi:DNA-binding GntR family transcriptional regulator
MKIKTHLRQAEPGRRRRNGVVGDEVARALRRAIFDGEFQPGDPLPEMHLAKRFGVSQAVIREVLVALVHAGLVRRIPNRGTFVTSLSPVEISELLRLRVVLETLAWMEAAERSRPADYVALQQKLEAIGSAAATGDYFAAAHADLEFHRQIWKMSGDTTLARLLDQIALPLFAFVSLRRSQRRDDLSHLVPEHTVVVDALMRRDENEIREQVRSQAERSYRSFIQAPLELTKVLVPRLPAAVKPGARRVRARV